jgi:hypothetical protein
MSEWRRQRRREMEVNPTPINKSGFRRYGACVGTFLRKFFTPTKGTTNGMGIRSGEGHP